MCEVFRVCGPNEIKHPAAWNRNKAGKIEGSYLDLSGHPVAPDPQHAVIGKVVVYARASTHKQRRSGSSGAEDDRVRERRRAVGGGCYQGSGVRSERRWPKLTALLKEDSWGELVVEHTDRLSPVRVRLVRTVLLGLQGRRIAIADAATEAKADLLDDFVSVIYNFAARLYGLRSARRRTHDVIAALDIDPKLMERRG